MSEGFVHCDYYISDPTQPACLRGFLKYARAPAHGFGLGKQPVLYATVETKENIQKKCIKNGQRVRVNMASRMGDVGIHSDLSVENGYVMRVPLGWLKDFSVTP